MKTFKKTFSFFNAWINQLFDWQVNTTFEEFATIVSDDKRSHTLDGGNVKLTYNALIEKVNKQRHLLNKRC